MRVLHSSRAFRRSGLGLEIRRRVDVCVVCVCCDQTCVVIRCRVDVCVCVCSCCDQTCVVIRRRVDVDW